jgi:hypothetical protein
LDYTQEFKFIRSSSRGQTPRFHTPRFVQGIEIELDEHIRTSTMFQQVVKYNVQMTYFV